MHQYLTGENIQEQTKGLYNKAKHSNKRKAYDVNKTIQTNSKVHEESKMELH